MQSERFYAALKGHGATTRLVILPHESHGYQARESIMHTLYVRGLRGEASCSAAGAAGGRHLFGRRQPGFLAV